MATRTSALGLLPPDLCRQKVVVPHKVVLGGAELAKGAFLVLVDWLVLPVPPHQQQLIFGEQEVPPPRAAVKPVTSFHPLADA